MRTKCMPEGMHTRLFRYTSTFEILFDELSDSADGQSAPVPGEEHRSVCREGYPPLQMPRECGYRLLLKRYGSILPPLPLPDVKRLVLQVNVTRPPETGPRIRGI